MSVIIDSGLGHTQSHSASHQRPDFDVAVTMRVLVMVVVLTTLAATGLFLYGQVSPGI